MNNSIFRETALGYRILALSLEEDVTYEYFFSMLALNDWYVSKTEVFRVTGPIK